MSDTKTFLKAVEQIESSGGQDTSHKPIHSGIHKGTSAVGRYALMPNTMQYVAKKNRSKYSDLDGMTPEQISNEVKENPYLEDSLAEDYADLVLKRSNGDDELANYKWQYGHNAQPRPEDVENNPRTQKYRKIKEMFSRTPAESSDQGEE